MQITVKNYRGIEEAEITLAPIALVAGQNGSGKTSIAQAVAAALLGRAVAIEGVNKGDAILLLRDGAKRGRCTVSGPAGSSTANWPGASTSKEGTPPTASAIACGIESIVDMKPKDAVRAMIEAMKAEPSQEQLAAAIKAAGLPDELLLPVWESIVATGWDGAHKRASESGTKRKGAWEHITGERYGAAKAASWLAPGTPENPAGLEELLVEQRGVLESRIAHQAVSEAEIESLRRAVVVGEGATDTIGELTNELQAARLAEQSIAERRQTLSSPQDDERMTPCPHCEQPVVIVGSSLRAPSAGLSTEENASRRSAIAEAAAEIRTASLKTADVNSRLVQARSIAEQGTRAAARLAQIPEGGVTPHQVDSARADVVITERQIAAATRTRQAELAHVKIEQGQRLIELLAPTGLRQAAIAGALAELNADLAHLAGMARWPATTVGEDMAVTYGGRPFVLLSASEQFRARVVLQVSLANFDGSDAIVIDAADILDRQGRNGLFDMLIQAELPALVCMTMNKPDEIPNLAKAGLGKTYWIGGGVTASRNA